MHAEIIQPAADAFCNGEELYMSCRPEHHVETSMDLDALADLVEAGDITLEDEGESTYYRFTQQGLGLLRNFGSSKD
jgi:hypothetical protein